MLAPYNPEVRSWHQRRVWVIGSSSGIGAAVAEALLVRGAKVALSARRTERLKEMAGSSQCALVLPLDVTDPDAWNKAYANLHHQWGRPDLVFFCAADYTPEHSWQVQAERARQTLEVNLASVYYGLEAILPNMLDDGYGGIALIASVAGYAGLPGAAVYGPSKAALINLAELLYCELSQRGLSVYLINPGFVKTALTDKNDFAMPALQTPEQAAGRILSGIEQGRFEIHFPKRFTWWLKLLRILPYRLRLALLSRLVQP